MYLSKQKTPHLISFIRSWVLVWRNFAEGRKDGRTDGHWPNRFVFACYSRIYIHTCPYLSRLFLLLHPLITKVGIQFFHIWKTAEKEISYSNRKCFLRLCKQNRHKLDRLGLIYRIRRWRRRHIWFDLLDYKNVVLINSCKDWWGSNPTWLGTILICHE